MSFAHNVRTLFCASVLSLSALGAGVAQAADEEAMQLRVGTESAYAPFEFTDNGTLTGFDIDLMNAVGEAMGAEVEWVQMSFDGLIPALLTSQLDMAIASFTVTEERAKRMLSAMYDYFMKNKDKLPAFYLGLSEQYPLEQVICDYLSSMTDKFAVAVFDNIFVPHSWALTQKDIEEL